MRWRRTALVLFAMALGCETQSVGKRCETNDDCEPTLGCQREFNTESCGVGDICVCCPQGAAALDIPACRARPVVITDAGSDARAD